MAAEFIERGGLAHVFFFFRESVVSRKKREP
jgi:hypothetical protein